MPLALTTKPTNSNSEAKNWHFDGFAWKRSALKMKRPGANEANAPA